MRSHPYPVSSSSPPPAPRPSRSGEPWTAEDYAAVVEACRDQEKPTIETVADAVGRTPNALRGRIKALLPLDLRGGPADMVPGQLRTALLTDDTYDWQTHLMATPPPAPVVEHVHPPAVLTGIRGLEDDELLAMARSMSALTSRDPGHLRLACGDEVARRGLEDQLETTAIQDARDRVHSFLEQASYGYGSASADYWAGCTDPGPWEPGW